MCISICVNTLRTLHWTNVVPDGHLFGDDSCVVTHYITP